MEHVTSGGDIDESGGSLGDIGRFASATVAELGLFLDPLPVPVFVDSGPGECLYVNPAYLELCGVDATQVDFEQWPMTVDDAHRTEIEAQWRRLWAMGEPYSALSEMRTTDRSRRWVQIHVTPILGLDGKVVRSLGVMVDEHDRVTATEALQRTERQSHALVLNSADAIVGIDVMQRVQIWNETAGQMFGFTSEQIIGQSLSLLLPPQMTGGHSALVRSFIEGDQDRILMRPTSVRARRRDGSQFPVEIALSKVQINDEQLAVATVRDVTERVKAEAERDQLHDRYRALIQNNRDVIIVIGGDGIISYVSPSALSVFGFVPEQVVGTSLEDNFATVHPDDRQDFMDLVTSVGAEVGSNAIANYRRLRSGNEYRLVENHVANYLDVDGLNAIVFNLRDVTEEVAAKAETELLNAELNAVLESFQDQLYRVTRDGLVVSCLSDGGRGDGPQSVVGRNVADSLPAQLAEKFMDSITTASDTGEPQRMQYSLSEVYPADFGSLEARCSPLPGGDVLVAIRDISDEAEAEAKLTYQALHDALTGLANRVSLATQLQVALDATVHTTGHVAVLFLDLDGFKQINDTLGHSAGDALLIAVAHRLKTAVRPGDTIARIGGDEFVVVCDELADPAEAEMVAERVLSLLAEPLSLAGTEIAVTASIGIAVAEPGGGDAETLLAHADAAMYRAKDLGRGRAEVFDAERRRFT